LSANGASCSVASPMKSRGSRGVAFRWPMRLASAWCACALLTAAFGAAPTRASIGPSAQARRLSRFATAAFGRLLHQGYGAIRGYWTCPAGQVFGSSVFCWAEFRVGGRWHSVLATGRPFGTSATFSHVHAIAWRRAWSSYSARILAGFSTPGTASVNGASYDWAFLGGRGVLRLATSSVRNGRRVRW
jgi:hypothetical protein